MGMPSNDDRRSQNAGRISLVGAGPGDARLLTLAAADALAGADAVLHTNVDPRVLDYVNPSAEVCSVRELLAEGDATHWSAHAAPRWLLDRAATQGHAVFLADGDPMLFSHGGELLDRLHQAGAAVEIVPGITAAAAAAAEAAIPITHAAHSSAVALVTARARGGQSLPEIAQFAHFPGTLALYMGIDDPQRWVRPMIDAGKPPETPVAVVTHCTRAEQQIIHTTLGELPELVAREGIGNPGIIFIGPVIDQSPLSHWERARVRALSDVSDTPTLRGRRVLVTRPRDQAVELVDRLTELGADVWTQPAIEIADPPDWGPVDRAIDQIERYAWLVFSSVNGVERLLGRLLERGGDMRRLADVRLAAIGPSTAAALERFGLRADLVPESYRAEALAEALVGRIGNDEGRERRSPHPQPLSQRERGAMSAQPPSQREDGGCRVLLARASRGREVLAEQLRAAGVEVEQVVVYTSRDVAEPRPVVRQALSEGRIDWVLVTSSAIARSLVSLFGEQLGKAHLASISPVTSATLRELGHEPAAEASEYTMAGIVRAVLNWKG